jgi:DNA-binding MarR family transcriptional regulator
MGLYWSNRVYIYGCIVTIDNMLPQKTGRGEIDNKIIEYLSTHPDIMATEIVKNLELDPANLSKQLKDLREKKGYVTSPRTEKSVKQQDRDILRLTDLGLGYLVIETNYDPVKVRAAVYAYRNLSRQAELLYGMIKATEDVDKNSFETLSIFYKVFVYPVLKRNVSFHDTVNGVNGFLKGRLGNEGYKCWKEKMLALNFNLKKP